MKLGWKPIWLTFATACSIFTLFVYANGNPPLASDVEYRDRLVTTLENGCELHEVEVGTWMSKNLRYMRCPQSDPTTLTGGREAETSLTTVPK